MGATLGKIGEHADVEFTELSLSYVNMPIILALGPE